MNCLLRVFVALLHSFALSFMLLLVVGVGLLVFGFKEVLRIFVCFGGFCLFVLL